jgi:hypothetical protein
VERRGGEGQGRGEEERGREGKEGRGKEGGRGGEGKKGQGGAFPYFFFYNIEHCYQLIFFLISMAGLTQSNQSAA